jgi:parvulin-like peptidyl-prolyl isomerase
MRTGAVRAVAASAVVALVLVGAGKVLATPTGFSVGHYDRPGRLTAIAHGVFGTGPLELAVVERNASSCQPAPGACAFYAADFGSMTLTWNGAPVTAVASGTLEADAVRPVVLGHLAPLWKVSVTSAASFGGVGTLQVRLTASDPNNGPPQLLDETYRDVALVPAADIGIVSKTNFITKASLDAMLASVRGYQGTPKPGTSEYRELQAQMVDFLVTQELFREQAVERRIVVTDAQVDERLRQLIQSFFHGSIKEYHAELHRAHLTEQQVKDNLRAQIMTERLFLLITKDVKVSGHKAYEYYRHNPSQYQTPRSRTVRHILVKSRGLAWRLYRRVRHDPDDFASLARHYSLDPSSAQAGGKLTIQQGQTVPGFDRVAFRLRTGSISTPVHTQFGWHIIQALSRIHPARHQRFRQVRDQIIQQLVQEQKAVVMVDWEQRLIHDADVRMLAPYTWPYGSGPRHSHTRPHSESIPVALPGAGLWNRACQSGVSDRRGRLGSRWPWGACVSA